MIEKNQGTGTQKQPEQVCIMVAELIQDTFS